MAQEPTQMTLSDLTSKTPEELNVMCAESIGWKRIHYRTALADCWLAPGKEPEFPTDAIIGVMPYPRDERDSNPFDDMGMPNYTGSWDAIMPEVRKLNMKQSFAFIEHLRAVLDIKATGDYAYTWLMLTATAQQLTIALILTLTSQH